MPQTDSAKKALRVSDRRRAVNDRWRRNARRAVKAAQQAMGAGKADGARAAFEKAQSVLDRAARHSAISPQAAARKKARLQSALTKLAA